MQNAQNTSTKPKTAVWPVISFYCMSKWNETNHRQDRQECDIYRPEHQRRNSCACVSLRIQYDCQSTSENHEWTSSRRNSQRHRHVPTLDAWPSRTLHSVFWMPLHHWTNSSNYCTV